MPTRDFFVYCTSLPPIQRRAIGALSKVQHIPEGQTIYQPGDLPDALFIINRGIVDLLPDKSKGSASAATLLSRGNIFGDLEVLTEVPRCDLARARQAVSLQCFERQNLPELLRRVPSFYRFLCEHLAQRLIQSREAAITQANDLEFSGNLANFDLITVYQTIVHSSQTGELSIVDERGELVGGFHFSSGDPVGGHFQHLTGEEAFWQLFLADDLQGTFTFSSDEKKWTEPHVKTIDRRANDLLFEAIQYRDEFQALKAEMSGSSAHAGKQADHELKPDDLPNSRIIMELLWRCSSDRPMLLSDLFPHCSLCELKIYQTVHELVRTGRLALSSGKEVQKIA